MASLPTTPCQPGKPGLPPLLGLLLLTLLALLAFSPGCRGYEPLPQLVSVLDVGPRVTTHNDTLELNGASFPVKKVGRVLLLGDLLRPGQEPERNVEVEAEGMSPNGTKVEVPVTEGLLARVCGRPEVALHTTFRGTVQVLFPAVTPGALPITGSIQDVVLDFRPSGARKAQLLAQQEEAGRVVGLLGLKLQEEPVASGGLLVQGVEEGSSAQQAGLQAGDVLVSLDGWSLLDVSDLIPSGRQRFGVLGVLRDGAVAERHIALRGYRPGAASDLVAVGAILGSLAVIFLFLASPLGRLLGWVERWAARGAAASSGRRNLLVWLLTCLAAFWRGDASHAGGDALPYVVFLVASGLCSTLPFSRAIVGLEPDVGTALLPALALALVVALGAGQHPQKRRWSPVQGLRLLLWTLLYHLPTLTAVACVVALSGSLMVHDVVRFQGGEPWNWIAFRTPLGPLLLLLFFAPTALDRSAEPTAIPDAEPSAFVNPAASRARSGASGSLGWGATFLLCGVGAALFLGGWSLPFVDRAVQERLFALQALGALLFLIKSWGLALTIAVCRETFPRLRIDQSTSPLLRWLLPLSGVAGALTAGWIFLEPGPLVRRVIAALGTLLVALLAIHLTRRVALAVRTAGAQPHVSPFL
ncbi:MAG: NADH-quinone oxidoreductase subunit H [Polyangiaceae bacterium]|nr:NADH-quinone oxidoreductase subunit H [Polyangiaceae bacterium]